MQNKQDDSDKHRYKKDRDGFKIESTDPVQDIMDDDELKAAEERIQSLIDGSDGAEE